MLAITIMGIVVRAIMMPNFTMQAMKEMAALTITTGCWSLLQLGPLIGATMEMGLLTLWMRAW